MYQKTHEDHDHKEPSNTIAVAMESNILYGTSNNWSSAAFRVRAKSNW